MMDPAIWEKILKSLEQYPGVVALLVVIYWGYRVIQKMNEVSKGDIERMSRLTTLLEILVNKDKN
jgi:hypothetical protein